MNRLFIAIPPGSVNAKWIIAGSKGKYTKAPGGYTAGSRVLFTEMAYYLSWNSAAAATIPIICKKHFSKFFKGRYFGMKTKVISILSLVCLVFLFCVSPVSPASLAAADNYEDAAQFVADIATTQYFTDEAVSDADLDMIVQAGINAPSAMNKQPWHFSVISDKAVLEQLNEGMSFGGGMPPMGAAPGGDFPADMKMPEGMEMPEGFGAEGAAPPEFPADMAAPGGAFPAPGGSGGLSKAGLVDAPVAIIVSCAAGSELDAGLACQNMSVAAQLLGYGTKIISSPTIALNGEKQAEFKELLGIPEDMAAAAVLLIGREDTSIDESIDGYTGATARNPMNDIVSYVKG